MPPSLTPSRLLTLGFTLTLTLSACASDDPATRAPSNLRADNADKPPRARYANLPSASPDESYDVNGDGTDDQRYFRAAGQLIRVERDINFDGRPDIYEHYVNGQLVEEELDLDLDGRVDAIKHLRDGVVEQRQYAIDFQEQLVMVSFFDANDNLLRVERDSNNDQRIDTWEHYAPGAPKPHRVEVDYDGDGSPDHTLTDEPTPEPTP